MFNKKYREFSISRFKEKVEVFNQVNKKMIKESEILFKYRLDLKKQISEVEYYLNSLVNTPKNINAEISEIEITLDNYQEILDLVNAEVKKAELESKGGAIVGVAAGAGVAAFAPAAAMGIATTFGVASTGTAISALSGAAATNAALAWLGGGAVIAGGGGMAGGTGLLILAGPAGWAIGGASLIGSGLLLNGRNKKLAAEANRKNIEVEAQTKIQQGLSKEIIEIRKATIEDKEIIQQRLADAKRLFTTNYLEMTNNQKKLLGALVNITLASVKSLNKTVGNI